MSRVLGGHRARSAGLAWQAVLDVMHRRYENEGLAIALVAGTKARAVRTADGLRFVPGPSLPDYIVAIRQEAGPAALVAFDAKTTSNPSRWSLPDKERHQQDTLARLAGIGALTFFLVECRPRELAYLIRVRADMRWPAEALSVRFDDLPWMSMPARELCDWLGYVKRMWWSDDLGTYDEDSWEE